MKQSRFAKTGPNGPMGPLGRNGNGPSGTPHAAGDQSTEEPVSDLDPIQQAQALKESLREALHKSSQLIVALRRQKKHDRLVRSTLASLKQLQGVGQ